MTNFTKSSLFLLDFFRSIFIFFFPFFLERIRFHHATTQIYINIIHTFTTWTKNFGIITNHAKREREKKRRQATKSKSNENSFLSISSDNNLATTQTKITLSHNWIWPVQKQVLTNSFWCNRLNIRLDSSRRSCTSMSLFVFLCSIFYWISISIDGIWLNEYFFPRIKTMMS